ncbi:MAG: hypothetical protein EON98_13475, partial [Chitinophagaceae bacterium]
MRSSQNLYQNIAALFLVCLFVGCASTKPTNASNDKLSANNLFPFGRTAMTNNQLELISSASHFAFRFEGNEC